MTSVARRVALAAGFLMLMGPAARSQAGLITYTESAIGSGSLGGSAFADRSISVSLTTDTASIVDAGGGDFQTGDVLATVAVEGIGGGTLTGFAFLNQSTGIFGIQGLTDTFSFLDILDTKNPALATYDLMGPIGPITGSVLFGQGTHFPLSSGVFTLASISGDVTFQAVLSSSTVPEPSSMVLGVIAGLSALGYSRHRRLLATA